jgi:tetratricopeptide (TPR) repeat protein
MDPHDDLERFEATEARELVRLFNALRTLPVDPAPAHFRAKVLAQVAERQAHRGWWPWLAWVRISPWVPALLTGLLLSLSLNVWLGYQVLEWDTQDDRAFTFRGGPPSGVPQRQGEVKLPSEADLVQTLAVLAASHHRAGQYERSLHAASAALALDPNTALAYFYRGMAYDGMGRRTQAIEDMRHAANLGEVQARAVLRAWGAE